MQIKYVILFFILISGFLKATTVKTIADGDWENPYIWSDHKVPTNPDSIIIYHYVTITKDFTINSPSVLYVDLIGTLCGEYLLETLCGTKLINYGHMYLDQIKTKNGINYGVMECKNFIEFSVCFPFIEGGFSNTPPGSMKVWPPVFCKTIDTNWESGHPVGLMEFENVNLKIYPNPIGNEILIVTTSNYTNMKLTDVIGNEIENKNFENTTEISFNYLPNGIYFLELIINGKKHIEKILKTN